MTDLRCHRCDEPISFAFPAESQPMDVDVACRVASCDWHGKAYQCVPCHRIIHYAEFRNRPCVVCGQYNLSWTVEPGSKTGLVVCNNPECEWWTEVR